MGDEPQKPEWRLGFAEHLDAWRQQLRTERAQGSDRIYQPGRRPRRAYQLTDAEIDVVARRMAEQGMERAINEWNATRARQRERAGVAQ